MESTLLTEMTGMNFHQEFVQNITEEQYRIVSGRLGEIAQIEKARVRELYFINENLQESEEDISEDVIKEVFWISNYYKPEISGIYLNKRCRMNKRFFEEKTPLSQLQYIKLMSGDYEWMKNHECRLLTEFYVKKQLFALKPDIVVEANREQYLFGEKRIHVHIDRDIVVENPKLEVERAEIKKMFHTQPIIMDVKVKENAVKEFFMQFYYMFQNILNKEAFHTLNENNEVLALA